MSTRDIQAHLRELYGTDLSHELISQATEGVLELFREWRSRPLYPIVYLDALCVSTRDAGQVTKRAFYIALGVKCTSDDASHLRCYDPRKARAICYVALRFRSSPYTSTAPGRFSGDYASGSSFSGVPTRCDG